MLSTVSGVVGLSKLSLIFGFLTNMLPSNRNSRLASSSTKHELQKKRQYEQVREIEHASFTPLVLSATGGMANEATVLQKASLLSSYQVGSAQ